MLLQSQFLVAWTTKWLLDPFNKSSPGVQNPTCVYLYHHCSWSNYQLSILSCLNHHFFLVKPMKSPLLLLKNNPFSLVKPPVRWNPTWRRDRKSASGIARTACFPLEKHHGNSGFMVGLWWFSGDSMAISWWFNGDRNWGVHWWKNCWELSSKHHFHGGFYGGFTIW